MSTMMDALTATLTLDLNATVVIRGHSQEHVSAELIREGRNVLLADGHDIEDALENLNENRLWEED